jgi:hypothetical protein
VVRTELILSVLAGFAGGLVGSLWSGVVSSTLLAPARAARSEAWHGETVGRLLTGAALYGLGGAVLGFLFWLSWGLIALVEQPWPYVGALFGIVCWAGATLPALAMLHLKLREPPRVALVLAVEWLVACLAIGLLCAMAWHRAS